MGFHRNLRGNETFQWLCNASVSQAYLAYKQEDSFFFLEQLAAALDEGARFVEVVNSTNVP